MIKNDLLLNRLNQLKDIPFEKWPSHGIKLSAVSVNADGTVSSGIYKGTHFYRAYNLVESGFGFKVPDMNGSSEFLIGR